MKFWIISDADGHVCGCEMTHAAALNYGYRNIGQTRKDFSVQWIEVPVTSDSIRRLLGGSGGYATATGEAV